MIEIMHRDTGAVLLCLDANILRGVNLEHSELVAADLRGADVASAWLTGVRRLPNFRQGLSFRHSG